MIHRILATLALSAWAAAAQAHVIEISDDGEARVYGGGANDNRLDTPAVGAIEGASLEQRLAIAARRYGVDLGLLRAVAWTESRGRNDAVSPKGARGVMQLMPATAAELGVDPSDPNANVLGGTAYLSQQLATFRAVPLALAAYNAGPGAVARYGGIPPYAETRAYVDTIMRRWTGRPAQSRLPASTALAPGDTADIGRFAARPAARKPLPVLLIEVSDP